MGASGPGPAAPIGAIRRVRRRGAAGAGHGRGPAAASALGAGGSQLLGGAPLRPWLERVEETHGFRYLDSRDLTGFIDSTENPEELDERRKVALIGEEDAAFAGASYVLAQRYVHRLDRWETMADEE